MFDTLLIANRGEIACRVIRSAKAMGLHTVAAHSEADRHARHVSLADTAVCLGAAPARESYLNIERVIAAALASGAQAIHPGYGFLSENAEFARACAAAGLVFVGPSPEAIDALGNKARAKQIAAQAGVPCLPGYAGADQSEATLVREAQRIGAPVMIKAAAGGGGRGMRRCDNVSDEPSLRSLLQAAAAEALASFGSGELLLERLVEHARHVEIQVFGDAHGNVVHLGERDCSTQRRHQKILEEAPAPGLTNELRQGMGQAAVKLVRAARYVGAGTVEFLLGADGEFHFLEVNTRLQVEHPVTEATTGLDLVQWQLRIAQGEPLPAAQEAITWHGAAIEARLCAEDAHHGFAPQSGRIAFWQFAQIDGVRIDHGLAAHAEVPPHYDSMIAKFIAHGRNREEARCRLMAALRGSTVLGLRTNRDHLLQCLAAPAFCTTGSATPSLHTGWLEAASPAFKAAAVSSAWLAIAAAVLLHRHAGQHGPLARFCNSGQRESIIKLLAQDQTHELRLRYAQQGDVQVVCGNANHAVAVLGDDGRVLDVVLDGLRQRAVAHTQAGAQWLDALGLSEGFADVTAQPPQASAAGGSGIVLSRMHGQLVRLEVALGQAVEQGQALLAIEAMKMEHRLEAPCSGTVAEVGAAVGSQVSPGQLLLRIA